LSRDGDTATTWCKLGKARLVLRLGPAAGEAARLEPSAADIRAVQLVDACEEKLQVEKPNGWSRSDWTRERKEACNCLVGLLGHSKLPVRAAAAERLAQERYWRGRRALTDTIYRMMGITTCDNSGCSPKVPAKLQEGLALVRMIHAQLRLRHWVREELLEALAKHPQRQVRLQLISRILSSRRGELPTAHGVLIRDRDPVVRARACNIGCQRSDRLSQKTFRADLRSRSPEVRAAALLYAGRCARNAGPRLLEDLPRETIPAVALLRLQSVPQAPDSLLARIAGDALLDSCPAVRFLAARLLWRAKERPIEKLKEAIAREPNPEYKHQLSDLLRPAGSLPASRHSMRLWLQY
jgi:hypothetical protein